MNRKSISQRAIAARVEPREVQTIEDRLIALAAMCETLARAQDEFAKAAPGRMRRAYHLDLAARLRIEAANMSLRIERTR